MRLKPVRRHGTGSLLIDVAAFFETIAGGASFRGAFAAGEIDQTHFADSLAGYLQQKTHENTEHAKAYPFK